MSQYLDSYRINEEERVRAEARRREPQRDLRGELVLAGVRPRVGMFVVHPERRRCYGRIVRTKPKTGEVVVEGAFGSPIPLSCAALFDRGCEYRETRPVGPGWLYRRGLHWIHGDGRRASHGAALASS